MADLFLFWLEEKMRRSRSTNKKNRFLKYWQVNCCVLDLPPPRPATVTKKGLDLWGCLTSSFWLLLGGVDSQFTVFYFFLATKHLPTSNGFFFLKADSAKAYPPDWWRCTLATPDGWMEWKMMNVFFWWFYHRSWCEHDWIRTHIYIYICIYIMILMVHILI